MSHRNRVICIPLPFVWLTPIKLLIIIIVITVMGLLITIGLITISLITVILVVILVVTLVIVILGKTWLVVIAARWWLAVNKNENFGNLYSSCILGRPPKSDEINSNQLAGFIRDRLLGSKKIQITFRGQKMPFWQFFRQGLVKNSKLTDLF